ncbi:hypothetical protein ACAG96_06845 [Candidatus Izemoplasma sp. B36]|uniref:hypothetical protein n=1 Tax=Candidatus Izemoplasma sp. B36 TaxID=3242468 RepID=UPI003555D10B
MNKYLNKQNIIYASIILVVLILLAIFMPKGILMDPLTTPAEYLASKPHVTLFNNLTIIVPSSTIIVYLLGIIILYIGYRLIKLDKKLWGISLIFWGLSTILAGSSYQGFGYELKCEGFEYCIFTSWFELSYLFFTAISIALLAIAFSKDFYNKNWLIFYSKVALVIYTILLLIGSIFEIYILISYELFTVFFMPIFLVLFIINIRNYRKEHKSIDKSFIFLWILFLIVNISYYIYYLPGFTSSLYDSTGIWFSANDVLHVGLIVWFIYFNYKLVLPLSKLTNQK